MGLKLMEVVKGLDACAVNHYCRPCDIAAGRRGQLEVLRVKKLILICLFASPSFAYPQQDSLVDVFPLAVGNSWRYQFAYSHNNIEVGYYNDTGVAEVSVSDAFSHSDTTWWILQEHETYREWGDGQYGAYSKSVDRTIQFNIIEAQTGQHPLSLTGTSFIFAYLGNPTAYSAASYRYQARDSSGYITVLVGPLAGSHATFVYQQGVGLSSDTVYQRYDDAGSDFWAANLLSSTVTGVNDENIALPRECRLYQNYPNPFNPSTNIGFSLPARSRILLRVFDLLGREVATLVNEEKPAGEYTVQWNAQSMPSGVYFYRIHAGTFTATKKVLLLR